MLSKKLGIFVLLYICAFTSLLNAALSYTIVPNLEGEEPSLKVSLISEFDRHGEFNLSYLDEAWGEVDLFNCIQSIQVSTAYDDILISPEESLITIKGEALATVEVNYIIKQDFVGMPNVDHYYRPIINKSYFHLFGHRLFMIPDNYFVSGQQEEVDIKWGETNFTVQHNLGLEEEGTYKVSREDLLESVIVGGDFRRTSFEVEGINVHFLTRGKWNNFSEDVLSQKLKEIIDIQRAFWSDYDDDIYTITLLPLFNTSETFIGGTGLSRGFASYCSNAENSKLQNLVPLYYHEIMHHWIGGKIRNASETAELWFSEGFTEYFSHLLMLKNQAINRREFEGILNSTYELHNASSAVELANDAILNHNFHTDPEVEKLPYRRGMLYALYLDQQLRNKDADYTLHDFLLEVYKRTKSEDIDFSNELFQDLLMEKLDVKEVAKFNKYIIEGRAIPGNDFNGPITLRKTGLFHLRKKFTTSL